MNACAGKHERSGVSSYKDIIPIGSEPPPNLMTLFELNYLRKGPLSRYSHIEDWGFTISTRRCGRQKHSVHNSGQ